MYERVIWPEKYDPKTSAIYALNDIDVNAPPQVVWRPLVDAENRSSCWRTRRGPSPRLDETEAAARDVLVRRALGTQEYNDRRLGRRRQGRLIIYCAEARRGAEAAGGLRRSQ
jgi:hypothetical protein